MNKFIRLATGCFLFVVAIALFSCKNRSRSSYATGDSMSGTIKPGQAFYIEYRDTFQRNEIVSFNIYTYEYRLPPDEAGYYPKAWQGQIFRLMAVSGDEIEMKEGIFSVNGVYPSLPPLALERYEIGTTMLIEEWEAERASSYRMPDERRGDTFIYRRNITVAEAEDFRQRKPAYQYARRIMLSPSEFQHTDFALKSASGPTSPDHFGPIRIPSPGDTVIVDSINFNLYQNIPGIQMGKNVIKEKLYFGLGDNRHAAADSRYNGFISHSKMKGIVKL